MIAATVAGILLFIVGILYGVSQLGVFRAAGIYEIGFGTVPADSRDEYTSLGSSLWRIITEDKARAAIAKSRISRSESSSCRIST